MLTTSLLECFSSYVAFNEWNLLNSYQGDLKKMAIKVQLPIYLQCYSLFCKNTPNVSESNYFIVVYLYLCPRLCFSPLTPLSFVVNWAIRFLLLYLDTALSVSPRTARHLHYRHSHQSWFCITAERSGFSSWLLINCSVGTQSRIVKYSPISSPLILFLCHCHFYSFPCPFHCRLRFASPLVYVLFPLFHLCLRPALAVPKHFFDEEPGWRFPAQTKHNSTSWR